MSISFRQTKHSKFLSKPTKQNTIHKRFFHSLTTNNEYDKITYSLMKIKF